MEQALRFSMCIACALAWGGPAAAREGARVWAAPSEAAHGRGTLVRATPVGVTPVALVALDNGAPDVTARRAPPRIRPASYVKPYPFGRLREDYTPYGMPGVPARIYFSRE